VAVIRPFRALRPAPDAASRVASVPYDVVDTGEARVLAQGNPLSFLHVSRAEIDLPDTVDPHDQAVYRAAADRYQRLKEEAPLVREDRPSVYLYRLGDDAHTQTGIAACFSLAEYDTNAIRKHERTRRDKEDDRTRHMLALRAQTGPVFLTHRPNGALDALVRETQSSDGPLIDFTAVDGVRHSLWRLGAETAASVVRLFESINALYIADGHHRAASAARARDELADSTEAKHVLGVAFPSDQVKILPYNRLVHDLNGMSAGEFLADVEQRFGVLAGAVPQPTRPGHVSMYVGGEWYDLDLQSGSDRPGAVLDSLDGNVLQEQLLKPVLGISDNRSDVRIDFVGGKRGTSALEGAVDSGRTAVAFSMYPVSLSDVMAVSDAGEIMPPKSTWFEPKLRDGLLIHEI
jgi:uncharacterized protein (DUF1015 family)